MYYHLVIIPSKVESRLLLRVTVPQCSALLRPTNQWLL